MTWVRIDEEFARHPKVVEAGPLGLALQVAGLCYCNQYLTDGFIPEGAVPGFLRLDGLSRSWSNGLFGSGEDLEWGMVVDAVVSAGLWEEVAGGYRIHDYHDYQPSKEEVLALREVRADAGRKGGLAKAVARAKQEPSKEPSKGSGKTSSKALAKLYPVPVPVLKERSKAVKDLPVNEQLLAKLVKLCESSIDERSEAVFRAFASKLPESSLAKVVESTASQPAGRRSRYANGALQSEIREVAQ